MMQDIEEQFAFEVGITEHCNLNCRGCSHFSPIAEPYYMDLFVFSKDMERLSFLFNGTIKWIHIMGGEPLLHPDCESFLEIARFYFPNGRIDLITNGLLLLSQPESFWNVCLKNKIVIKPTKYPIRLDYDKIREKAQFYGVSYRIYNYEDENSEKRFTKYVLDPSGSQNAQRSFSSCSQANKYITLREGKLYTCPTIPYSRHFSRAFDYNLSISTNDYVDIFCARSKEEIKANLASAPSFCRFCDHQHDAPGQSWKLSRKDREEWLCVSQ